MIMKLFLLSSSITEELVPDFENLIGRHTEGLKVAFITDATRNMPAENLDWKVDEFKYQREKLKFNIEEFRLTGGRGVQDLYNFDALFIVGGSAIDLHEAMKSSGFTRELPKLLEAGMIYIGSSVSSMICSESMDTAVWYLDEPCSEAKDLSGLGLIDFQIYPHYLESQLEEIVKYTRSDLEYWLLKDGQAIAVEENKTRTCVGSITIINSQNRLST